MKEKPILFFEGEYDFLSNFYPSQITDGNEQFATVEHYFQAAKTLDMDSYTEIAHARTPGIAKTLGRRVTLRRDWEEVKDIIMWKALQEKFSIPELKTKLLATGDAYLEEGTWWHDNYWGNCHCPKCEQIQGKNRLGNMLMRLRDCLRYQKQFETLTYRPYNQHGKPSDRVVFNSAYNNYKYAFVDEHTRYELLLKKLAEYEGV